MQGGSDEMRAPLEAVAAPHVALLARHALTVGLSQLWNMPALAGKREGDPYRERS